MNEGDKGGAFTMSSQPIQPQDLQTPDEIEIRTLYHQLLDSWNRRDADAFAAVFAPDGESIGFDGSQLSGQAEIAMSLRQIFTDHITPPYLSIVRNVRLLSPDVAILRAIAGMVPPGKSDIEPNLNSVQSLVAVKRDNQWCISLFQNTPAQLHGRPELVQQMTEELRQLL